MQENRICVEVFSSNSFGGGKAWFSKSKFETSLKMGSEQNYGSGISDEVLVDFSFHLFVDANEASAWMTEKFPLVAPTGKYGSNQDAINVSTSSFGPLETPV